MMLTGPPRLDGIVRRYASAQGPVTDDWDDRSTYLETRAGTVLKGSRRLWPSWQMTLVATAGEWLAWRSDLRGDGLGEFEWTPRTRRDGDPAHLAEHSYRARVRGGLRTLTPVRQRDGRGELVYVVDVVIEGVRPYEREPGTLDGGYERLAETRDEIEIATYGDATITPGPSQVVVWSDGEQMVLESVSLGPDYLADVRTTDDGDAVILHTTTR